MHLSNAIAALIMGAAISGMHYTAMTAVTFYEGSLCARGGATVDANSISEAGFYVMFAFVVLVLLGAIARHASTKTALLGAILDNSRDGIIVTNMRGKITLFSPAAERLFGYTATDATGRKLSCLLPLDLGEDAGDLPTLQSSFAGKNWETQAQRRDGGFVNVEVTVAELQLGGETIFSSTIRDITPRKELEKAQFRALMEVSNALDQQKELNQAQREFVATVSHEFRTPLAIIDSAAQRLLRHKDKLTPERVVKRIDTIREAIVKMTDLIESTLAAERMDTGAMAMTIEDIEPAAIIEQVCRRQRELARDAVITTDLAALPANMHADPGAFDQIFTNLLSNAVKYCRDAAEVSIVGRCDGGDAIIEVADRGVGIDDDELPKMFNKFFRASTSAGIPGTGIGLHLVRQLVEAHEGSISVRSEKDVGSTFTIRLPLKQPASRCAPAAVREIMPVDPAAVREIMPVDNETVNRRAG